MPLMGFLATQRGRTGSQSQREPLGVDICPSARVVMQGMLHD